MITVAEADMAQIDHQFSRSRAGIDCETGLALEFESLRFFLAQRLQRPHTSFVARAPRPDPFAQPDFFFGEFLVEFGRGAIFDLQQLVLLAQIIIEIAGKRREYAAVQFDDAGRQAAHKGSIMSDEDHRAVVIEQILFHPMYVLKSQWIAGSTSQSQTCDPTKGRAIINLQPRTAA